MAFNKFYIFPPVFQSKQGQRSKIYKDYNGKGRTMCIPRRGEKEIQK